MSFCTRGAAAAGAVTALTVTVAGLAAAPAALAATPRAIIGGTRPGWALSSDRVNQAGPAGSLDARVYLAGRDPAGLAAYAAGVSTPGGPLYRHFLTPAQASARFGVSGAEIAAVRSWLTGAGLRVSRLNASGPAGAYLAVHGSLAAAGRAFAVSFGWYRGPHGQVYRAPGQPASVPAMVAGSVLSVTGLDTAPHVATPAAVIPGPAGPLQAGPLQAGPLQAGPLQARPGTAQAGPPSGGSRCSSYFGQHTPFWLPRAYGRHWPTSVCGYIPRQLRGAYGVTSSGMTGQGQAVAIVDAYDSPTIVADATRYARLTGDPVFRPGQFTRYQAGPFTLAGTRSCGPPRAWNEEQTLDVESLHGVATSAALRYVAARSCRQQDLLNALAFVVNHHLASIVSDSWGWGESDYLLQAAANAVFQLGAAEGTGFFFSTGDHGYVAGGKLQVQYPASSPWVTAVGGTSLAAGPGGQYRWESSWGTVVDPLARAGRGAAWQYPPPGPFRLGPAFGGGGGGVSTVYPQPAYQRGIVPLRLAATLPGGARARRPMRVLPDVSADADSWTGLALGISTRYRGRYVFETTLVGGTSLACPTIAAIEASAQQAAGGPLGFADPAIYARYGTAAFHDVTGHPLGLAHPSVTAVEGQAAILVALNIDGVGPLALRAAPGYDDATGVGTPARYIQSFRP